MKFIAIRGKRAARAVAQASADTRASTIRTLAELVLRNRSEILKANVRDVKAGSLSPAKVDRLTLDEKRVEQIASGLRAVASLPDPVGKVVYERRMDSGILVRRVRVPIGLILMIYEARPNVTCEAAAICIKSGNACILRGGSEAKNTNAEFGKMIRASLVQHGLPAEAVQVIPTSSHADIMGLLKMEGLIDLVIPRGGESLIRAVARASRVPVIKHYRGNCHVYVHSDADLKMAEDIVFNAKVQRPATCNAAEKLLVHKDVAAEFLPSICSRLRVAGVEIRGDAASRRIVREIKPAKNSDWFEEYLDLVIAVKTVDGIDEAIEHISRFGSAHTDSIVTCSESAANKFLNEVDSASVMWNASTRLADGGEYGLGAEIGISTDKLHARGPMGVEELTCLKWVVVGNGQIRK